MRTTVDLPDHLLAEAEQLAAERSLPLARLFEDSLRSYLSEQRTQITLGAPPPLPILRDPKLVEGISLDDTSRLWEID